MAIDIRDQLIRSGHLAAALREAGVLLAIFGPVSVSEIFKAISLPWAGIIRFASALVLLTGIDWDVRLERKKQKLAARGLL
jgi:hypothetical protein